MGYLTTITFYNDEYHQDAKKLGEKVKSAMLGTRIRDGSIISHPPVHSHDIEIYVSYGNGSYSGTELRRMRDTNPEYYKEIIDKIKRCYE